MTEAQKATYRAYYHMEPDFLGQEYTLEEDEKFYDEYNEKTFKDVTLRKGTKMKVVRMSWSHGYFVEDEKGRLWRTWEIKELSHLIKNVKQIFK